ncbi:hypothetical protein GDO81_008588 [Engystomops pustulosus]|uniref:Thrombomodulin n=1 Tax=Engystomops pustulosus TaxID=76066 RepID=A0AAV7CIE1_ENGPU|nr:hypothetical protein GDO81_008588 [Engystomops pustulosus]
MQLHHFSWSALLLAQLAPLALSLEPEFLCIEGSCYSSYWFNKRFTKSRQTCTEKKGELLTAQSSQQQHVMAELMGKVQAQNTRAWIGLERKDGCTDLDLPLRGFTWVTGGSYADFPMWTNDGQTCGASCVTVGKDGTWEETSCDSKAEGVLCEISYLSFCLSLNLPSPYNINYFHPSLGRALSESTVPRGERRWTVGWSMDPGAWSCLIGNGGCEGSCVEESGVAKCKCPSGLELKDDQRSCTKPCDPNPCSDLCAQISDPPGYRCMCSEGFKLGADGKSCEDIDDCAANPNICEHHCTNTIGGYRCSCHPGYEMVESTCDPGENCTNHCQDTDECNIIMCEQKCENYPGGYRCFCHDGFVIDEKKPTKCKPICNTSDCLADCDKEGCRCPQGYIVDEPKDGVKVCTDMDECIDSPCGWLLCINTLGSFTCICPEGFTMLHNGDCIPPTPSEILSEPTIRPADSFRPADLYSLQPTIMWGFFSGLLSLFIVLIVMLCHRMRRHYTYQHDLEYSYKNPQKNVELKKIMMEPQKWI